MGGSGGGGGSGSGGGNNGGDGTLGKIHEIGAQLEIDRKESHAFTPNMATVVVKTVTITHTITILKVFIGSPPRREMPPEPSGSGDLDR